MTAQTVEYICHSGSDLLVVNSARVSFSKESKEFNDKDEKLINFLAREKHLLPFRHPSLTLRCKAPMFVARQLGKHQTGMSWSEESRRYIKTEPEFYWPDKWRKAADNVKQGSSDETHDMVILYGTGGKNGLTDLEDCVKEIVEEVLSLYNTLIKEGVAPEQARMILPQNVMINWVWTGTLLAWVHLIKERTSPTAQRETKEFAKMVEKIVREHYPISAGALLDAG